MKVGHPTSFGESQASKHATSLAEVKALCKEYGILNTVDYKKHYRKVPGLMAHPERLFAHEWVSYNDLFDIPEFPSYDQTVKLIRPLKLASQRDYKKYIRENPGLNLPFDPQGVYGPQWKNWFVFLGKPEPYRPDFIPEDYAEWKVQIEEFMKQARGGGTKVSNLCRFVREFVQTYDKSTSPQALLTKQKVNIKPFRHFMESITSNNMRRALVIAVNDFLDWVIDTKLTDEDEETGEIVRVLDARNPFSLLSNTVTSAGAQPSESTKPYLPYHFVKKAQNWMIPPGSRSFKDLKHLQKFDADWTRVDRDLIDYRDPDCVVQTIGNQTYLWVPTDWIHTFTLTKIPLRGRQIAYTDSGEGDKEIADWCEKSHSVSFLKNPGPFKGSTQKQSFIKKYTGAEIGTYVTTNKTSNNGQGYAIPWMPEDLAYWLIKLRKWQQKYNPIDKPTSWSVCQRTNLNEVQRQAKGVNCFLFRAFGDVEPRNVGSALTGRLAAALYNIQPNTLELAKRSGSEGTLHRYKSAYTPHSMRVSLITAYVMEFGMPIEMVMKIVGHSSIVMSIYYCKVSNSEIRNRLEESEKIALKSQAESTQRLIERNKIDEVKNQLVSNNQEILGLLSNSTPAANFVFRDYGICPFAASRCHDGGALIGSSTNLYSPAPSGYLGEQNCLRCRHFITGPAFLGGLLSISNEILLQSNLQAEHCDSLQTQVDAYSRKLEEEDRKEYLAELKMQHYDATTRNALEFDLRKLESEYESAAKKMDVFLSDLQSAYRLIQSCSDALKQPESSEDSDIALIKHQDSEIRLELEEVSNFQQLQEICENATIYQSANADNAILPRSQMLDRMALFNDIAPSLFLMDKDKQLQVGNQIVQILHTRLKSWSKVDRIVNCQNRIDELAGDEAIKKSEIELILKQSALEQRRTFDDSSRYITEAEEPIDSENQ